MLKNLPKYYDPPGKHTPIEQLAYINARERRMLKSAGGLGRLTRFGVRTFYEGSADSHTNPAGNSNSSTGGTNSTGSSSSSGGVGSGASGGVGSSNSGASGSASGSGGGGNVGSSTGGVGAGASGGKSGSGGNSGGSGATQSGQNAATHAAQTGAGGKTTTSPGSPQGQRGSLTGPAGGTGTGIGNTGYAASNDSQYTTSPEQMSLVNQMNYPDRMLTDTASKIQKASNGKLSAADSIVATSEMAKTAYGELGPEYANATNLQAIDRTMLNRLGLAMNKGQYGGTATGVLNGYDANGYDQARVSSVASPTGNSAYRSASFASPAYNDALSNLKSQVEGSGVSLPSGVANATNYHTVGTSPSWANGVAETPLGPHTFSNPDIGRPASVVAQNTFAGPVGGLPTTGTQTASARSLSGLVNSPNIPTPQPKPAQHMQTTIAGRPDVPVSPNNVAPTGNYPSTIAGRPDVPVSPNNVPSGNYPSMVAGRPDVPVSSNTRNPAQVAQAAGTLTSPYNQPNQLNTTPDPNITYPAPHPFNPNRTNQGYPRSVEPVTKDPLQPPNQDVNQQVQQAQVGESWFGNLKNKVGAGLQTAKTEFVDASKKISAYGGPEKVASMSRLAQSLGIGTGGMGGGHYASGHNDASGGGQDNQNSKSGKGLSKMPKGKKTPNPVVVATSPTFSWIQWEPGSPPVQVPTSALIYKTA